MQNYDAIRNEIDGKLSFPEDLSRQAHDNGDFTVKVKTEEFNRQQHEHLTLLRDIQQQQQQYKGQVDEVLIQMSQIQEALKPLLSKRICHLSPLPPPTPSHHVHGALSDWKPE